MKRVLTVMAALAAGTVPAAAGNLASPPPDPVIVPPPPPPAPVGIDWTGPYAGAQLGYGFGDADGTDLDGIIGGLQAGYNYDFGRFVLGAEADFNLADMQLDGNAGTIDQVGRLKVKAGYELGRVLPYVTAGGAYASASDTAFGDLSDFGWVAGAGIDVAITPRIVGGVEYLYHQFDDFDGSGIDADVNTVAAKVSYRF